MTELPGNLLTTAMGILPHQDVDKALEVSMSLDIPFWPQLPKKSFYEDMYVQFSENFPGIQLDFEESKIVLNKTAFFEELEDYVVKSQEEGFFGLSEKYSQTFDKFLTQDLSSYTGIKGQVIGPISFGLKIVDEDLKPIIFEDDIKTLLFEFTKEKINYQYKVLRQYNDTVMIHIDEPGLEFIFNSFSGYTGEMAKKDLAVFFAGTEGPRTIHLCGNPDWDFLLSIGLDLLSFDAYSRGKLIVRYPGLKEFIDRGGIVSWGIVPAHYDQLEQESIQSLEDKLEEIWDSLEEQGLNRQTIVKQSQLAPATCSVVGAKNVETVEKAYKMLIKLSGKLRNKYNLS